MASDECGVSVSRSIVLIAAGKATTMSAGNGPSHLPSSLYLQATGEQLVRFCGSSCSAISHTHFFKTIQESGGLDRRVSEVAI